MSEYIIGISAEVIERAKNGEKILITPKLTEVVRCRNCKYLKPRDEECGGRNWCKRMSFEVVLDGFCAWGVRKDD